MPKARKARNNKTEQNQPYNPNKNHPNPSGVISNMINSMDRNAKQLNQTQKARISQMAKQAIENYHSKEQKPTKQISGHIATQLNNLGIHASNNTTEPSTVPKTSPTPPGCELVRQYTVDFADYDSEDDGPEKTASSVEAQTSACELSFDSEQQEASKSLDRRPPGMGS